MHNRCRNLLIDLLRRSLYDLWLWRLHYLRLRWWHEDRRWRCYDLWWSVGVDWWQVGWLLRLRRLLKLVFYDVLGLGPILFGGSPLSLTATLVGSVGLVAHLVKHELRG